MGKVSARAVLDQSVKSPNPNDPGPDKIRTYLMKNKMTARIVRF